MAKKIAVLLIGIFVVVLGRGLYYYGGFYRPPSIEMPYFEWVAVPLKPSTEYSDVYEKSKGNILLDVANDNAFEIEELNVLMSRLISRGLTIEFSDPENDLEEELTEVDGFIIACPQKKFSKEDRDAINTFVDNGGKLMLVGDPTRGAEINSISLNFGFIFEPDYLYNLKENDANFKNIFVTKFKENGITKGLEKIAFYTAGSITTANVTCGIALVDENTFSSVIETRRELSPIALASESKVLAIHDFTFMTEPYNGILDNNRLISNIADWLASPIKEEKPEGESLE